jgi:hypothetical protein
MRGRIRACLSYANVIATLALFIALGGTAYAALKITGADIVNSSVTTLDIKNHSLLKKDFHAGQLPAGPRGLQGPQGPQGLQGNQGPPGNPDAAGGAPAYAFVNDNATLGAASRVKNFDRASNKGGIPEPALYCLHTTVVPHNVVATVSPQFPAGWATVEFFEDTDGAHCPERREPFNIIVRTFSAGSMGGSSLEAHSFTIAVN